MEITVYCEKLNRRVKLYCYFDSNNVEFLGCDEANGDCSMCVQEHLDEFFKVLKDMAESPFYKEEYL
ncbi:MAG: hypothetical protein J6A49_04435 [Clostridia bacterium]|nr:hypothetical protein [Clostridia bacterium]